MPAYPIKRGDKLSPLLSTIVCVRKAAQDGQNDGQALLATLKRKRDKALRSFIVGHPNRQVRICPVYLSSLGRHFSAVQCRIMRFSLSGWRRFPHWLAAWRV